MSNTKLTLTYFPFGGKAEPIRLAAAIGGVSFTNKVLTFSEFAEARKSLPFGQVPVLQVDTLDDEGNIKNTSIVTQSDAILRYFGKLAKLYPTNDFLAMKVDEMLCVIDDLDVAITMTIQGPKKLLLSEGEWSAEEKIKIRERWVESSLPKYVGMIENTLKASTSGWLVGDSITIADIKCFVRFSHITSGILDGIPTTVLDKYPNCLALMEKVKEVDGIKSWNQKYSMPYGNFDYK